MTSSKHDNSRRNHQAQSYETVCAVYDIYTFKIVKNYLQHPMLQCKQTFQSLIINILFNNTHVFRQTRPQRGNNNPTVGIGLDLSVIGKAE